MRGERAPRHGGLSSLQPPKTSDAIFGSSPRHELSFLFFSRLDKKLCPFSYLSLSLSLCLSVYLFFFVAATRFWQELKVPKISSQSSGKNSQQTRQDENVRDANEKAIRFLARFADIILEIEKRAFLSLSLSLSLSFSLIHGKWGGRALGGRCVVFQDRKIVTSHRASGFPSPDIYFQPAFCLENFIPAPDDEFFGHGAAASRRNKPLEGILPRRRRYIDARANHSPCAHAINENLISLLTRRIVRCLLAPRSLRSVPPLCLVNSLFPRTFAPLDQLENERMRDFLFFLFFWFGTGSVFLIIEPGRRNPTGEQMNLRATKHLNF